MSDTFTCQFCGEKLPSADTFHDLASCYAHLKVRIDSLEAENARLKMIIDDYRSDIAKVLNDRCPTDEKHCGCVPILRGQINNYQKALELIITLAKRALEEVRDE